MIGQAHPWLAVALGEGWRVPNQASLLILRSCYRIVCFVLFNVMSTVHEILSAMDKLTREELRILKLGVDSRLADDDNDPVLLASLKDAIAYADTHPAEAKSIDEVRALIPQWISESKSQARL